MLLSPGADLGRMLDGGDWPRGGPMWRSGPRQIFLFLGGSAQFESLRRMDHQCEVQSRMKRSYVAVEVIVILEASTSFHYKGLVEF